MRLSVQGRLCGDGHEIIIFYTQSNFCLAGEQVVLSTVQLTHDLCGRHDNGTFSIVHIPLSSASISAARQLTLTDAAVTCSLVCTAQKGARSLLLQTLSLLHCAHNGNASTGYAVDVCLLPDRVNVLANRWIAFFRAFLIEFLTHDTLNFRILIQVTRY